MDGKCKKSKKKFTLDVKKMPNKDIKQTTKTLTKDQEKISPQARKKRSMTDQDYEDLFEAVLREPPGEEKDSCGKTNNLIDEHGNDVEDDMDSIHSEEVDNWLDSSKDDGKSPQVAEPAALKHKQMQKKAERCGTLKPRQLLFPGQATKKDEKTERKEENGNQQLMKDKVKADNDKDCKGVKENEKKTKVKVHKSPSKRDLEAGKSLKVITGSEEKNKKVKTKHRPIKHDEHLKGPDNASPAEEDETGTWIQCSSSRCNKWRYVADIEDPTLVPSHWECSMNADKEHNSCDAPEVDYDETEHICTTFTIGTIVWAKMDGYPWWPGMIEPDPDYDTYFEILTEKSMVPFQYHVTFFDDHVTRAWIRTSLISPFGNEPLNKTGKHHNLYKKEVQQAISNAKIASILSLKDRVAKFGFSKRYTKKSKWHERKVKPKIARQLCTNKAKKEKLGEKCPKSAERGPNISGRCSESSDLDDDMSEEQTEYFPVHTKSRRTEQPLTAPQKSGKADQKSSTADSTTLKDSKGLLSRTESMEKVESDSSDESSSDDDTRGDKRSKKVFGLDLDSDVFTMEADTVSAIDDGKQPNKKDLSCRNKVEDLKNKPTKKGKDKKNSVSLHSKTLGGEHFAQDSKKSAGSVSFSAKNKQGLEVDDINNSPKSSTAEQKSLITGSKKVALNKASKTTVKKKETGVSLDAETCKKKGNKTFKKVQKNAKDKTLSSEVLHGKRDKDIENCITALDAYKQDLTLVDAQDKLKHCNDGDVQPENDSDKENKDPSLDSRVYSEASRNKTVPAKVSKKRDSTEKLQDTTSNSEAKRKKFKPLTSEKEIEIGDCKSSKKKTEKNTKKMNSTTTGKIENKGKGKKIFSAPIMSHKEVDREVPEIDTSETQGQKSKGKLEKWAVNPHVVPDLKQPTCGHESSGDEMEECDQGDVKHLKAVNRSLGQMMDTTNEAEDSEQELNLDVCSALPQKLLNTGGDSDASSGDDEQLDLQLDPLTDAVASSQALTESHIFGRFAGACRDHASDSDPLDLIED